MKSRVGRSEVGNGSNIKVKRGHKRTMGPFVCACKYARARPPRHAAATVHCAQSSRETSEAMLLL